MTKAVSYWKILTRKKVLPNDDSQSSKLGRVLGTLDLAALGIGATLGVGVYVLAGHVSRDQAGPSVILSFLIAAAASFLAGLCYAEFGARVPKSGSAYIYSYVCIGEFIAFIIGWNLLLEYIIGSASVSKGLSLYLDTLINDTFKNTFTQIAPMHWDFLADYFDFFSFCVPLFLGVAMAFGLKKSTIINNVFTVSNIGIVLFVIIAGSFKADISNWNIPKSAIPPEYQGGEGGFFPFGFSGTLKGAATCFFGYVGFDCIATTGEEVRDPKKAIPMAILISLFTIFMAYFGVSTVLTLMWPYYLQDVNAPLPHVFNEIGWYGAKWVVAIGGIFGLIASLFGAMFPLPRIIYAIAQDGLIFRFLGDVNAKFQTPVTGTLCAALLTGTFSALFDLKALVNMLSIGTLLAYTVVAISILILRFSNNLDDSQPPPSYNDANSNHLTEGTPLKSPKMRLTMRSFFTQFFNINRVQRPDSHSMAVAGILVCLYVLSALGLALMIFFGQEEIINMEPWALALTALCLFLVVIFIVALSVQPRERKPTEFTVPLVPILPGISIFVNIFLMLMLDYYTWIRFAIWMAIGIPIYIACVFCNVNSTRRKSSFHLRELHDVVKLNGTINRAYEEEYNTYVHEMEYSKSHSDTVITKDTIEKTASEEVEEIINKALLTVEKTLSNEIITSSSQKSSSPTKSFDEIVLESEVIDQLIEKKSGNGALYFTDEIKSEDEDNIEMDDGDSSNAIAMLDDILEDEENHDIRKTSDLSLITPNSHEPINTVAIIHHENNSNNYDEPEKSSVKDEHVEKNEDAVEQNITDQEDDSIAQLTQKEQNKPVLAALENTEDKDFIKKLNTLFLQKTVPNRKVVPMDDENDTIKLKKETPSRPSLLHSRSEISQLYLKELENKEVYGVKMNKNDVVDKNEKICVYDCDGETGEYVCTKMTRENIESKENEKSSNIPEPPKFDPELYNKSLGRTKAQIVLKEMNNDEEVRPNKLSSPILKDESPVNEEKELTIKEKLEKIFRNTLPLKVKQSIESPSSTEEKVPDSSQSVDDIKSESKQEEVQRASSFKTKAKKFDTVEKQKAIFANVIKELDPDKPKNLQHTPSFNRKQLTEVFKLDSNNNSNRNSLNSNNTVKNNDSALPFTLVMD
uniref:CSON000105 protein n=1 Tax=Culicoides sonorensis TaxID=179676 RepID=A0A336KV32_CULSO